MKVRSRQEVCLLLLEPARRLVPVTLGTGEIATGVIGIAQPVAVVTLFKMAAKVSGATRREILQSPKLTGQQPVRGAIGRTVAAEDVRHLEHAQSSGRQRSCISCLSGSVTVARTSCVRCV